MHGARLIRTIASDDGFCAAELIERPDGLFQFRGLLRDGCDWAENMTSGLYREAALAEERARAWVHDVSGSP